MKTVHDFQPGDRVNVVPRNNDLFAWEWTGTVIGYAQDNTFVQVRDQDDDVFDCDPEQLFVV